MPDPPPISTASPTPTVFNTPQQNYLPPPMLTQVAGTSLCLAFQTPSTIHSSATSVLTTEYDEEDIAAAGTAVTAMIDDSSLQLLPSYLLRLAGRNGLDVNLSNVLEEAAELGDDGDSNVEGDDAHEHDVVLNASLCICLKKPIQLKIQTTVSSLPVVVVFCWLLLLRW
jgi:hypothetical protein